MTQIVMLLANAFRPDPRVLKEADSLAHSGYQVTVICWDREAALPAEEILPSGVTIRRIHSVLSRYGAGWKQLLRLPRFWLAAVKIVRQLKPALIHCHDLDTLPAGWLAKRSTRAKLVFDAHEDYPALMSLYLPRFMIPFLRLLEKLLIHRADGVITASTVLADRFRRQGISPLVTVGNYQDLSPFDKITPDQVLEERRKLGLAPGDLMVAYIGGFTRNRLLLPFIHSAAQISNASFFLWGDGHQRADIERAASGRDNVRYLGWLPSDRVPLVMKAADIIYYCLKPDYPGAAFNASNTLTYAMAAGKPVIANPVGDLGRMVQESGCGLLIDPITPDTIAAAVKKLAEPTLRRHMGERGRFAAETKYNWSAAFEQLLKQYRSLLSDGPAVNSVSRPK